MNHATLLALTRINRSFYTQHAEEFDHSRQAPWPGWDRVLEEVERRAPSNPLRALDLGCGNGRFLRFLAARGWRVDYWGVDWVVPNEAQTASWGVNGQVRWVVHDFVTGDDLLPSDTAREYDFIALFGVLHHVPSFSLRQRLLRVLADRLAPRGLLAATLWQFGAHERFRHRIVDWHESERRTGISIDPSELEPSDFLVAWGQGRRAARYCHHTSPEEWDRLVAPLELATVDEFVADGYSQNLNAYRLVGREG